MKHQRGFSSIVIIIAIVAILIATGVFVAVQNGANLNDYNNGGQQITQTQQPVAPPIENSSDLDAAATDLDNTDIDQVDTELNQIDADASTF